MAQSKRYFTFPLTLDLIFPEGDSDELKDMLLRDYFAFFELIVEKLPMLESTIKQIGGLDDVEILSISQTEQHIIEVVFCIKDVETLNNFYEVANKENDNRPNKLSRYISAFAAKHMEFANFRMYMPVDLYQTGRERLTASKKRSILKKIALPVVFGIGAMVAAPLVLSGIGFTSAGIGASTIAAKMMSVAARANGGGVAAKSIVAVLQSAGVLGISAGVTAGIGATAAGTTAIVQEIVTDKEKCDKKRP